MEQEIKLQFSELKEQMIKQAEKQNGFKDLTPFMGKDKMLSSAAYMLRLKRIKLENNFLKPKAEELFNDFCTVSNEYISDEESCEVTEALEEIKSQIEGICIDIKGNQISTTSQVTSKLDVTTLKAINLDFIFDEIDLTFKFLTSVPSQTFNVAALAICNKKHKECVKRNEIINNFILSQLSIPYKTLKQHSIKTKNVK